MGSRLRGRRVQDLLQINLQRPRAGLTPGDVGIALQTWEALGMALCVTCVGALGLGDF